MSAEDQFNDEWWAGLSLVERTFFRDVMRLAQDLLDGEVLRLTFNGQNFSPVMVSKRKPGTQVGRVGARMKPLAPEPDEWWEDLSSEERSGVRELAKTIARLEGHMDECLEMVRSPNGFKATHSVLFKRPAGGRAEVN